MELIIIIIAVSSQTKEKKGVWNLWKSSTETRQKEVHFSHHQ